jgi:hypothetical protein
MRCTDCSALVRPVVALDLDGTLGDYHGHFRDFAAEYLNRPLPTEPYPYTMEFSDWLGIPKDEYRRVKLAYRQGGMKRTMPAFPHAADLVRAVTAMGAEVWYATTRPWERLDNVDPDTKHWLERNGMPPHRLIYGEDKYRQLLHNVEKGRIVAVLDDLPEQVREARDLGLPAVQRVQSHDFSAIYLPCVANLEQAISLIEGRVDRWMKNGSSRTEPLFGRSG